MDVRDSFGRAAAEFEQTVARLADAARVRPTVCDVSIRELVRHVVTGNYFASRLPDGASADEAVKGLAQAGTGPDLIGEVAASCAAQT